MQQKPTFEIFKKSNMVAVMTIIIYNLQLKYRKVCAGRNLRGRSFSFSLCMFPILRQQKLIFKIFLKFNMAAITDDNYREFPPGILKYVLSVTRSKNFIFFKNKLSRYFFEMIQIVLSDSCYDLKCPIYSCFLIG